MQILWSACWGPLLQGMAWGKDSPSVENKKQTSIYENHHNRWNKTDVLHRPPLPSSQLPFINQDLMWVPAWFRVSLQQPLLGVQVWWWVLQALQLRQHLHSRGTRSSRCPLLPPHRYTAERIQAAEHQLVAPSGCPAALCRLPSRQWSMQHYISAVE